MFLSLFNPKIQLLVSDDDVNNYNKIKTDLDKLRLLVEQSELWIYKKKENLKENHTSHDDSLTSANTTNSELNVSHTSTSGVGGGMASGQPSLSLNSKLHLNVSDHRPTVYKIILNIN